MWLERFRTNRYRLEVIVATIATTATLVFVLSRCSPMNASIEKDSLTGSSTSTLTTPQATPNPSLTPQVFSVFSKPLLVHTNDDQFRGGPGSIPSAGENIALSPDPSDSPDQFAEFKSTGKAEITLDGVPSNQSSVSFKLASSAGASLSNMQDFTLVFKRVSDTSWSLQIASSDLAKPGVKAMLSSLERLTIAIQPVSDN